MIRKIVIAAALIGAVPAQAFAPPASSEVRIPRMGRFLEWRPDGIRGLYVRADNGRWYYARLDAPCPRLADRSNVSFIAAPNGDFDRFSQVVADGWRCQVASVTNSDGPPTHRRHG